MADVYWYEASIGLRDVRKFGPVIAESEKSVTRRGSLGNQRQWKITDYSGIFPTETEAWEWLADMLGKDAEQHERTVADLREGEAMARAKAKELTNG